MQPPSVRVCLYPFCLLYSKPRSVVSYWSPVVRCRYPEPSQLPLASRTVIDVPYYLSLLIMIFGVPADSGLADRQPPARGATGTFARLRGTSIPETGHVS